MIAVQPNLKLTRQFQRQMWAKFVGHDTVLVWHADGTHLKAGQLTLERKREYAMLHHDDQYMFHVRGIYIGPTDPRLVYLKHTTKTCRRCKALREA